MKAKPRGSIKGLKARSDIVKQLNSDKLLDALNQLAAEKPNEAWTLLEVSRIAGLKSTVAINSVWNAHVKLKVKQHNESIQYDTDLEVVEQISERLSFRDRQSLRSDLIICQKQRNEALSKIAIFAADAEYHKKKCADLARIVDRLQASINGVSKTKS